VSERRTAAWRVALSMFTVVPAGVGDQFDEAAAARAILWLPAIGALVGGLGGGVVLLVGAGDGSAARRLLGAALAVGVVALLTGGLHLDGLADTADGLGSRRPAAAALDIMRRSDIGPMGVATLVLCLLVQVAAVAAIPRVALGAGALVLAEVTGRVSVVVATALPAARPGGFGALVAGRTSAAQRGLTVGVFAVVVFGAGFAGGPALAERALAAGLAGLAAGWLVQSTARRRLGGVTGDVFGAVLVTSATATLVIASLVS
jgi:adenosylcobinamide-GDP ribazoletransferase